MRLWRWAALTSATALLAACTSSFPNASDDVPSGLRRLGSVAGSSANTPAIVLLSDRHETHGAITHSSAAWTALRKANARAVRFLVNKGYRLLGTEASLGSLPDDDAAAAHHKAWTEAREDGEDIDSFSLYQPLRFQWEHAERLEVFGVEDEHLYALDVAALERINALKRADLEPAADHTAAKDAIRLLVAEISGHADLRGAAAARNLHERMQQRSVPRAMLMLGSAHCPAAVAELQHLGYDVLYFRADAIDKLSLRRR
ncbi:MAG: hypothetical protein EXS14_05905 [Planctomycetes bacterium]|nr:hypothetical protein [Planctomycetota bacterium]